MSKFYGEIDDITSDSATLYAYFKSDTSGFKGTRYIRLVVEASNGGSWMKRISGDNTSSYETEWEYTITGLSPRTTYSWEIQLGYKASGESSITYLDVYDSGSFTTSKGAKRPNDFSWTYPKVSGQPFLLMATEWNNFTLRINDFREYCGYSTYSFTTAYKGNTFTAAMYNQARKAIQGISGYGAYIPTVSSGDTITAYQMNILVDELNAIP